MLNKANKNYPLLIFKIAVITLIIAMPWSRALTSIATGLIFISGIVEFIFNKAKFPKNISYFFLLAFLGICALDVLRSSSLVEWFSYFNIKLPLILISFSVILFKSKITPTFIKNLSLCFCISIATATIASTINYIIDYEKLTALVLQSKPIPIMGEIHHITFSVFCALAVIISGFYAYQQKIKWLWIFTIINLVGLHILTARTGLAGFYFSCFVLGIIYIINHKPKLKYLLIASVSIILLPVMAYFSLSGFKNRIINTWEDVKVIWNNKDANYQSMGMRIEASKTAIDIFKKNPLIGVGISNINKEMSIQYQQNKSHLYLENRILPHNQFVIEAAIHGIIGLTILILFFAFPFYNKFQHLSTQFIALWALVFFACMFECLFDRQHVVILVSLFWFLYQDKPKN